MNLFSTKDIFLVLVYFLSCSKFDENIEQAKLCISLLPGPSYFK